MPARILSSKPLLSEVGGGPALDFVTDDVLPSSGGGGVQVGGGGGGGGGGPGAPGLGEPGGSGGTSGKSSRDVVSTMADSEVRG